ncbi:DUF3024 domain-containing protein [Pantoea agglomerans]|uniref:DUF3024 domain-containing protein n=1 Tax=Enterobacter agglomerans TaxID=549 RepID=UPI00177F0D53|nr:DUF3024 domain-containing protein [Pantoea agglomerans]WVL88849.1 DUF3024 domain-containing protein [Pantoea agglomerans]
MAFSDLEFQAVKKEVELFVKSIRPSEHARNELDIVYTITDQYIDIGEIRPVWRTPGEKNLHHSVRIRYVRTENAWKLYWMRRDMKWHLYSEEPTLTQALEVVRADPDGCFFG